MTSAAFITKWADLTTGNFKDNTSRDITEAFLREFTNDITTLTDLPIIGPYWPLGGVADLTSTLTIDGNDHDLIFGDPNSLDEFQVNVNNNLHLHAYDGVDHTHVSLHPSEFSVLSENSEVVLTPILFSAIVNEGADSSTIDLSAVLLDIVTTDITATVEGLSVTADDGVDSGSFILTPASLDITINELNIFGASGLMIYGDLASDAMDLGNSTSGQIQLGSGVITFTAPIGLPSYTVATVPSAAGTPKLIYVTDEIGGPQPAWSNGSTWLRITDGNVISDT